MMSKYHVIQVDPKVLGDYDGMNYYAAKAMKFRGRKLRKNDVLVDKRLGNKRKRLVIRHEKLEAEKMRQGLGYWLDDKYARKHEKNKR
jgi:hypothetical protein